MRRPLYLITDDNYRPLGAIVDEGTRYIGLDTHGVQIFNRKDYYGAMRAGDKRGKVVSTAWYGVQS